MFMAKQPRTERRRFVPAVQAGQSLSRHPAPPAQQTVTRPAIVPPQVEIASEPAVPVHALSSAPIQAKLGESKTERKAREAREADIQAAQNAAPGKGAAFGDMHQAHMQELAENQRHLRVYQVELQDRIDRGEIGLERDVSKLPGLFGGGGYDLERDRAGIQKRFDASPLANQVLFSRAFTSGAFRGFKAPEKAGGAYYQPGTHQIAIEPEKDAQDQRGAYSVLFHEANHFVDNQAGADAILPTDVAESEKSLNVSRQLGMDSASLSQLEAELDKKRKGFQPGGVWEKNSSSTTSPYSSHISTHSEESAGWYEGARKDYENYRDNFFKVAHGKGKSEADRAAVEEAIKKRLYFDIVRRAQATADRGGDLQKYGGSVEAAQQIAGMKLEQLKSLPLKEQRQFLIDSDPLSRGKFNNGKTEVSAGVQDAFRGFAHREMRDSKEGKSRAEKQRHALNKKLALSLPWGHEYEYNTSADKDLGLDQKGNHSTMNEMMANMSEAFMDDNMEKQLYFEEFMPNATQAYQRTIHKAALGELGVNYGGKYTKRRH
ncbi:hypothetical protein B5F10_10815 [Anaerotruncus colihominis]|uniref:Uncharacterized protein n=1 Tax=Anaerotruncus colihominis TaxID=169435 RepID=A0A1Y4N0T8_9FIRM|nr:hypothetical protein [Anaerotruncus colihominis]OUP68665.1 hypothetical protein B5F11_12075 [Anaerotruncus colihominis]OUP73601.1 hypothetical protein B5F10_10815 [Anaerotruncus colihominis]